MTNFELNQVQVWQSASGCVNQIRNLNFGFAQGFLRKEADKCSETLKTVTKFEK